VPKTDKVVGLSIETVVTGPEAIVVNAASDIGFEKADVFATAGDRAFTAKPEVIIDAKDPHRALIKIKKPDDVESLPEFLKGKQLNVILVAGEKAVEKNLAF
jgi:hypothetical protein